MCLLAVVNEFFFFFFFICRHGKGAQKPLKGRLKLKGMSGHLSFQPRESCMGSEYHSKENQQNTPFAVSLPSEREVQRYFSNLADFVRLLIPHFLWKFATC